MNHISIPVFRLLSPDNIHQDATLTRRFPALLSQWVLDSGTASALWMLNLQHLGCRTPFPSCFCSWLNLQMPFCVHPKMSSVYTKTDKYFFLPPGLRHKSCWACDWNKKKKPVLKRLGSGVKEDRRCWISQCCSSLSQQLKQTHQAKMEELKCSAAAATAGQQLGRLFRHENDVQRGALPLID